MAKKGRSSPVGKGEPETRFLGFSIKGAERITFRRHVLVLAALSLVMKLFTILLTTNVFSSFIDLFDITYYLNFAAKIYGGQIPYVQFSIDYPQGALLSILLPLLLVILTGGLPALASGNPMGYVFFHQALMCLFDVGTVVLVYLIGLRLYNEKKAFLAGILYATAFSAAYFVLTKYDSYPTFFLLLSVALFVYGRATGAYLAGAWGFLAKWFPVLAMPYFLILDLKKGVERETVLKNLGYSVLLVIIVMLPFIILNPGGFIQTYQINAQFNTLAHGFIYYLDFILKTLTGATIFSAISIYLAIVAELGLLYLVLPEACHRPPHPLRVHLLRGLLLHHAEQDLEPPVPPVDHPLRRALPGRIGMGGLPLLYCPALVLPRVPRPLQRDLPQCHRVPLAGGDGIPDGHLPLLHGEERPPLPHLLGGAAEAPRRPCHPEAVARVRGGVTPSRTRPRT